MYKKNELNNMNTAALAYMGDAVYEEYVRRHLLDGGARRVDRMQRLAAGNYVSAKVQSEIIQKLMDEMGEEERQRIKRWRNYKPKSKPKNTDTITYQWATAFEALVGYLYLNEDEERLHWLIERSFEMIDGID